MGPDRAKQTSLVSGLLSGLIPGRRALRVLIPGLLVLGIAGLVSTRGAASPAGAGPLATPPDDGKYENVVVEGRPVAMVHVKNGGDIVLVDIDGKKPRTWEEQFKRKGNIPRGTYNVHKTNVAGAESFENVPIDREGTWTIDEAGNITAH